jgi:transcriptional enhancer factor
MSMNYEGSGASYSPNLVPTSHSPSLPAPTPQRRQAHEVFEKIMKGRKSWKTLRDGDLVWPEELERALVEGWCPNPI